MAHSSLPKPSIDPKAPSSSSFKNKDAGVDGDGVGPKFGMKKDVALKLLNAAAAFKYRNGVPPTPRSMEGFMKEVKDLFPEGLTKKQLHNKLRNIKYRMRHFTDPNDSDFQKLNEPFMKTWGAGRRRRATKKSEEEIGHANNEQCEPYGEKGGSLVLDGNEPDYPFPFLRRALQELWIEKKLDPNVLQVALQKVDPVKAKHLDAQFLEIAKDEIKFEIERNELANEIIKALGGHLRGVHKRFGDSAAMKI